MKKIAYLIGNQNYIEHQKLINAINDANSLNEKLYNIGFDTEILHDLSRNELGGRIYEFGTRFDEYDICLFYYAGHGAEIDGENYMIPIDAKSDNVNMLKASSIKISDLTNWMECHDKAYIIILDACRTRYISDGRGIEYSFISNIKAPKGTFIAYATSFDKTASDGLEGDHGYFTKALLNYIDKPGLKIEDIFKNTRNDVLKMSNNKQIPWEYSSLVGDLYLVEDVVVNSEIANSRLIYEYAESIWDDFEENYNIDEAEALVFMEVANKFDISLMEVYCAYSKEQGGISGRLTLPEQHLNAITRFKTIGFYERFSRWYYKNDQVRMGEILPLPLEYELLDPEEGREIFVNFNVNGSFQDNKYIIEGICNLPNSMTLILTMTNFDFNYIANDKVVISDGKFRSNGFTMRDDKIKNGVYGLTISSGAYSVQSETVKNILGYNCRNILGDNTEYVPICGRLVKFSQKINIE